MPSQIEEIDEAETNLNDSVSDSTRNRRNGSMVGRIGRLSLTVLTLLVFTAVAWGTARNTQTASKFTDFVETKAKGFWQEIVTDNYSIANVEPDSKSTVAPAEPEPSSKMITTISTIEISSSSNLVTRRFAGSLKPTQSSSLGFNRIGTIKRVMVDVGAAVKKGDLLVELDIEQLLSEEAVLIAERNVQKAKLQELISGPRKQKIESARAVLKELEALNDQAKMTYDRLSGLIRENAVALQDVDNAKKQLEASENRVSGQRQVLAELLEGTRSEKLDAQEALLEQLDARLLGIRVKISESKLFAPFDGIVSLRNVDDGAIVLPGAIVMRLIESKPPEAWVGLPVDLIEELRAEELYVLAVGDNLARAKLKAVLPELDQLTRTQTAIFEVEGQSTNDRSARAQFALGQIVRLEIPVPTNVEGFWVPRTALSQNYAGTWSVFTVETGDHPVDEGVTKRQPIIIERVDSENVLVRGDLKSGDRVVAKGLHKLTPGQKVRMAKSPLLETQFRTSKRGPSISHSETPSDH